MGVTTPDAVIKKEEGDTCALWKYSQRHKANALSAGTTQKKRE
ncbi:hypothetical protein ACNKHO_22930 [Shigella flexneri]